MQFTLIKNPDESKIILYKIARIIYAETNASSLCAVEALASMISNICIISKRELSDVASDKNIFESLNRNSIRHKSLLVDTNRSDFQMCLRVTKKMLDGKLNNFCCCATRFHHSNYIPDWALSIGYIAEIDDLLFYL